MLPGTVAIIPTGRTKNGDLPRKAKTMGDNRFKGRVGLAIIALTFLAELPLTMAGSARAATNPQSATTGSTTFQVNYGGQAFTTSLPSSSVATFKWTPGSSTVNSWDTTSKGMKLRLKLAQQPAVQFGTPSSSLPSIIIDPSTSYQSIDGFGGAMTDSSAYLINNSPQKDAILSTLFGSSGANFNLVRLPLGASDFISNPKPKCSTGSPKCYAPSPKCDSSTATPNTANCFQTYDDTPGDTSLSHFSIAHDTTNIIPVLQAANTLNPKFEIIAAPWSAPGWMKISGQYLSSCSGSSNYLSQADYTVYAAYLTKAVEAYEAEGLPISVLSMQNEPHNCNSTYPTMMMEPSDQAELSLDLNADLTSAGLTTVPQIMGWDHNWYDYNNLSADAYPFCNANYQATSYPQTLLALPNAVSDIGYHSYCGNSSVQAALNSAYPSVGIYVTESSGFTGASNQATNLVNEVKNDLIDPLRSGAKSSLYWNLALDPKCGPQFGGGTKCNTGSSSTYSGCMDCRGMVTVNNVNGTYTLNEDYYFWAQFSKFIEPGAFHIDSSTLGSIDTVAFENPDGSIVLVALSAPGSG
jgi:glucosylceramidase